jgi:hypothetical protein
MSALIRLAGLLALAACASSNDAGVNESPCSPAWNESVERQLSTGDGYGHGPDIGSLEWRSVVEFKLGIRNDPSVPAMESDEWCRYIDELL